HADGDIDIYAYTPSAVFCDSDVLGEGAASGAALWSDSATDDESISACRVLDNTDLELILEVRLWSGEPTQFTGDALTNGGLSNMTVMNLSDNQITDLMDFTPTSITSLDVQNNSLTFDDLELLLGQGLTEAQIQYAGQTSIQFVPETRADFLKTTNRLGQVRIAPRLDIYTVAITTGGSVNQYNWFVDGTQITSNTDYTVAGTTTTILGIDIGNMGEFSAQVTNTLFPDLTLLVDAENIFAVEPLTIVVRDSNTTPLSDEVSAFLLEAVTRPGIAGYDTLERVEDVIITESGYTFEDVVLGDYLISIDPSNTAAYIPTYFGDAFEWELAATYEFREAVTLEITITEVPGVLNGEGSLSVLIEEDFGDDGARIDARRRAARRKCGLKKRRSGGRDEQDEFELIAYGETDDNGEFQFGFLPQGVYRFFVEYPGIPLDESAFVEFEVGEAGVSETDFALTAFASEDGIQVSIEEVLGVILEYFKNLEVYPNPTTDWLKVRYRHLKAESVSAQLVDVSGNEKWASDLRTGFDGEINIDVSGLPSGVYLLRFYDRESRDENVMTYRVVIRH
ncbi:MAG: T9SS type A sorting domain-containing protein, partial [Bacteroidota bacterium]